MVFVYFVLIFIYTVEFYFIFIFYLVHIIDADRTLPTQEKEESKLETSPKQKRPDAPNHVGDVNLQIKSTPDSFNS